MKHMRRLICMALMIATVLSLSVSAFAAEYTFDVYVGFGVLPLHIL